MSMFATPRSVKQDGEGPSKADLVDTLAVFKVVDFDPETKTRYGTSATCKVDLTVVSGPHKGHFPGWFCAGNLAAQIGGALDPGQQAPGRIVTGTSANGRAWFGIEWATDPADMADAEKALAPEPKARSAAAKSRTLGEQVRATVADVRARAAGTEESDVPPF